ncbi:MAG TPA: TIGR00153 family protein [Methanobacterium sp.]
MRNLFKRESVVEQYSKEHVELVYECLNQLRILMEYYYKNDFEFIDKKVDEISKLEHDADDIRRKMEIEFFKGAFLPFDREDRIILAEDVDSVADIIQETAFGIYLARINFPSGFKEDFSELMISIYETVTALKKCIELLDEDLGEALTKAHEVERLEDAVDKIERKILKRLYISYKNQEINILTQIELKSTVLRLGNIADRAENASDRVPIIVAKRKG